MKKLYLVLALLVTLSSLSKAKFDEFEDGDDIVEYDDNDFAEFEDVTEDVTPEPAHRDITTEEDEEEATVENESQDLDENQEDFEDADGQEGNIESEPYDDEEFEGYDDKLDPVPGKNKDPIEGLGYLRPSGAREQHLKPSWVTCSGVQMTETRDTSFGVKDSSFIYCREHRSHGKYNACYLWRLLQIGSVDRSFYTQFTHRFTWYTKVYGLVPTIIPQRGRFGHFETHEVRNISAETFGGSQL